MEFTTVSSGYRQQEKCNSFHRQKHQASRKTSKGSCWQVIGECYVDGKMEGEALYGLTKTEIEALTIEFELR